MRSTLRCSTANPPAWAWQQSSTYASTPTPTPTSKRGPRDSCAGGSFQKNAAENFQPANMQTFFPANKIDVSANIVVVFGPMGMPRQCSHEERYDDGRCKVCTRKRHREGQKMRRVAAKLRRAREAANGPSLADLMGCDLI